ncbi:hypothetical protein [Chroococcidiopsis sp. CCMEE 29]|uniref:hypothetical protein n=1 Tax=Chroococcidiopsis sp. CCMEE 29 TaxID=155894 RepID=UPI002021A6A1|nr:hypothetical protein [Chroococcidiopsis sp. CCMEE 29]
MTLLRYGGNRKLAKIFLSKCQPHQESKVLAHLDSKIALPASRVQMERTSVQQG